MTSGTSSKLWSFTRIPLRTFEEITETKNFALMYVDGRGRVTPEVVDAFEDIYLQYYETVVGSKEYVQIHRDYAYNYSKFLLIGVAMLLLEKGRLKGSKTAENLKRVRIRYTDDEDAMAARLVSAHAVTKLQLQKSEAALEKFNSRHEGGEREHITDGVASIGDYLGYYIPVDGLTLAQYCQYYKIVKRKSEEAQRQMARMKR